MNIVDAACPKCGKPFPWLSGTPLECQDPECKSNGDRRTVTQQDDLKAMREATRDYPARLVITALVLASLAG